MIGGNINIIVKSLEYVVERKRYLDNYSIDDIDMVLRNHNRESGNYDDLQFFLSNWWSRAIDVRQGFIQGLQFDDSSSEEKFWAGVNEAAKPLRKLLNEKLSSCNKKRLLKLLKENGYEPTKNTTGKD